MMLAQKLATSGALGRMQPRPTIATSAGGGACGSGPACGAGSASSSSLLPCADVAVQLGDARHAVAQRGDLADHVHAPLPLLGGVDGDELGVGAVDALRRDPQAADVQLLEAAAQLLGVDPLGAQAAPLGLELLDERGRQATRGVAGPALEQGRVVGGDRRLLEQRRDRAGLGGLAREQVAGAHQRADLRSARARRRLRSRRPSRPSGRRGCRPRAAPGSRRRRSAAPRAGPGTSCPRARSSCAGRRGRRTRAPRTRSGARRPRGTASAAPARARAGRSRCRRLRARAPGRGALRRSARTAGDARARPRAARRAARRARSRAARRPTSARRGASPCARAARRLRRRASARARGTAGRRPPATAAANSARSLTRVIGPCTSG